MHTPLLEDRDDGSSINGYGADKNSLERLFDHFIKEIDGDPIPLDFKAKLILGLQVLGASAGIYSLPPALVFAKTVPSWIGGSVIVSNPTTHSMFLLKATGDFLNEVIQDFNAPPEALEGVLRPLLSSELRGKYLKIVLGAIVCAIPFAVNTYFFPVPGCKEEPCLGVSVAHSWLSNVILHALSWNIIFQQPIYRFPIVPFEMLASYIHRHFLTDEAREAFEHKGTRAKVFAKYQGILSQSINAAAVGLIDSCDRKITSLGDFEAAISGSLLNFIRYKAKPSVSSYSLDRIMPVVQTIGAGAMVIGCSGWVASPFALGEELKWSPLETASFGVLPAYATGVLCAFFGANVVPRFFQYLLDLVGGGDIKSKISLEGRLFPVIFSLLMGLNIYMSAFSFTNGVEYIENSFSDSSWDAVRPAMIHTAIISLILLSVVPLTDLINSSIRGVSAVFGPASDARQREMRVLSSATAFSGRLSQVSGDNLMSSLESYSREDRAAFGIEEAEFRRDFAIVMSNPSAAGCNGASAPARGDDSLSDGPGE